MRTREALSLVSQDGVQYQPTSQVKAARQIEEDEEEVVGRNRDKATASDSVSKKIYIL